MNQLDKQLCCMCGNDLAVMAFNKDWVLGNNPHTSDKQYPSGARCCDPCNQGVVAERLQDHKDDKISSLYSGAENFLNEMGSDYDKY
jgi:hypothetical protein